jgi:hypothetical protein
MMRCTRRSFIEVRRPGHARPGIGAALPRAHRLRPGHGGAAEDPHRRVPAWRGGRPQHGGPARRSELLPSRGSIAVARPVAGNAEATVDLDGFFGLHPAMAPLKPLWDDQRLAIVHACGSPDTTRSHFDAQDYMESGTPGVKSTQDGWLARGLSATPRPAPHRSARWPWAPSSALSPRRRGRGGHGRGGGLRREAGHGAQERRGQRAERIRVALRAGRAGHPARHRSGDLRRREDAQGGESPALPAANGAQYPRGRLGDSLKQIAQLIKADVGLEVAFATAGAGILMPIRATSGDSSPSASASSPRAWPRCTATSAIA